MPRIYIRLLNEGTEVFRPTSAELIDRAVFKVLPIPGFDPCAEDWEFIPGSLVECETRKLEGVEVLVAVRAIGGAANTINQ